MHGKQQDNQRFLRALRMTVCCLTGLAVWCGDMAVASAELSPGQITVWTRRGGDYIGYRQPKPLEPRLVKVPISTWKRVRMYDIQYKKYVWYIGVSLPQLLRLYQYPAGADTALLHFKNKMVVPYPLRLMKKHNTFPVFLAFARWVNTSKRWVATFPLVSKSTSMYRDVRPIRFQGNKIVVSRSWHPAVKGKVAKSFNVWRHIDSLTGIEFVDHNAYYQQFALAKTVAEKKGEELFHRACQFCHSVQDVGSRYGWDFVRPLPIYKYRQSGALYMHIKYRRSDAVALGIMMPAMRTMTRKDALSLWIWLRAIATQPLNSYTPKYTRTH